MRGVVVTILAVALWAGGTFAGQAGQDLPIAVFEIDVSGIQLDAVTRKNLTELLAVRLAEEGQPTLAGEEIRVRDQLLERGGACSDPVCQRELTGRLQLKRFVSARVLKIGGVCSLVARLYALDREAALRSVSQRCSCEPDRLAEAAERAALRLAGSVDSRSTDEHEESVDMDEAASAPAKDQAAFPAPGTGETGVLSLNSVPWGQVWIDGVDTGQKTPLLRFPLASGRHSVEVLTADGERLHSEVEIWKGESSSLILRSAAGGDADRAEVGWLSVNTRPWSEVTVDSRHVGMTPLRHRLRPGKHVVRLGFAHGETKTEEVEILPGQTTRLVTQAETPPAFPFEPGHGLLKLHTSPWGRVWIDGKDSGKATPVFNRQLPAGHHRITIHFSTGGFMTEEVEIRAGETTRKIVRESR